MKIFKNINKDGKCIICNTNKDGEVCLVKLVGTEEDNIMEAGQVHIECLDLYFSKELSIIVQKIS